MKNNIPNGRMVRIEQQVPGSLTVLCSGGHGAGSIELVDSSPAGLVSLSSSEAGSWVTITVDKKSHKSANADVSAELMNAPAADISFDSVGRLSVKVDGDTKKGRFELTHSSKGDLIIRLPASLIGQASLELHGNVPLLSSVKNDFGLKQDGRRSLVRSVTDSSLVVRATVNWGTLRLLKL
ncbi:hypothetical protein [Tsuneonella sp. SYSU-LHT278]|uniref:hypothetical protein n=1 Tax=Tsuneonella sediminis TaxID=3416089 RepID=UPI003F7AD19C